MNIIDSDDLFDIPVQEIDLTSFNRNRIHINIIGTVLPFIGEQSQDDSEYWAILHLRDYKQCFKKYNEILDNQKNFNTEIDKFLQFNKHYLMHLTCSKNVSDETKMDSLLRYYLYKIVDEFSHPESHEYRLDHFEEYSINGESLKNPFPDKQEIILQDMKTRFADIVNQIIDFNKDIEALNQSISDFQGSLKSVIDTSDLVGLKGNCPMEAQLNYKTKIRSFFHRQ